MSGFKRKPIGKVFAEENKIGVGKRKRGGSEAVIENFLLSFENGGSPTKNVSPLASEWPAVNEQVRSAQHMLQDSYLSNLRPSSDEQFFASNIAIKRQKDIAIIR